jgi:hypothetical protein
MSDPSNRRQFDQKRTVLPRRNWIQRNPRLFQGVFITSCILVLFSKPIYDAFIRTDRVRR